MLVSRSIELSLCNPVGAMMDHELCIALAREAMGWGVRQRDGKAVGVHPDVMTARPLAVPDWTTNAARLEHLESVVKSEVGSIAYREELGRVAGELNSRPSMRQRCEAALLAVRRVAG